MYHRRTPTCQPAVSSRTARKRCDRQLFEPHAPGSWLTLEHCGSQRITERCPLAVSSSRERSPCVNNVAHSRIMPESCSLRTISEPKTFQVHTEFVPADVLDTCMSRSARLRTISAVAIGIVLLALVLILRSRSGHSAASSEEQSAPPDEAPTAQDVPAQVQAATISARPEATTSDPAPAASLAPQAPTSRPAEPACPEKMPAAGASCSFKGDVGLRCAYQNADGREFTCDCEGDPGGWRCAEPVDEVVPHPPCPSEKPSNASACSHAGHFCVYPTLPPTPYCACQPNSLVWKCMSYGEVRGEK